MTTTATQATAGTPQKRTEQTKTQIMAYLAHHGASTVTDITQGVPACKDTIKARLAELEESGTIRANIPVGQRGGTTPYYSVTATGTPRETPQTVITVYIKHATDGQLTLAFDNYPGLNTTARSFIDIPVAAREAAAHHTGQPQDSFTIHIRF